SSAKTRLTEFKEVVANSGSGDTQNRIENRLRELTTRLQKLKAEGPDTKVAVKRTLFELAEADRQMESVMRELRSIADQSRQAGPRFEGGPSGIWTDAHRRDAEFSQSRIESRSQRARSLITAGVLETLKQKPDRSEFVDAYNWSLFLYRLVRGELSGVGGVKTKATEEAKEADPHLAFLRRELKEALQTEEIEYYERVAREYLHTVEDYLQY
ncbi:MAG: hypothetical protein KGZ25_12240, partial [Planctomycetes bacterium]|nr:hypothetical protein [Planctomycetota bacterium]